MSRIGKMPILMQEKVTVKIIDKTITVDGPLGSLYYEIPEKVDITLTESLLSIAPTDVSRQAKALSGTVRAIVANMVRGVALGFEKKLSLVGVGYRAQVNGHQLKLLLGFSHDVEYILPDGVMAHAPSQTEIIIKGIDKQKVGQVAAEIRAYRPPEPYKGKGVKYSNEVILLKETKKK